MAVAVLAAFALVAWRFARDGYLPQPFHYDVAGSLMDLYNTAYWANRAGAYEVWHAIYPPLSFVFLRLASIHACYGADGVAGRHCDWLARWVLVAFFAVNGPLVFEAYRRVDPRTALPRAVATSLGLPMLYGLDRGNLLIPCFTFFVLGQGGLLRSRPLRWLSLAVSLNFKPYLLMIIVPYFVRRQWRWLAGLGVAGLAVYLVSFALEGSGTPGQIFEDIRLYLSGLSGTHWANIYYATSFWPLAHLMTSGASFSAAMSPGAVSAWGAALRLAMRAAQAGCLVCLIAGCLNPSRVNVNRFGALAAAFLLTTVTAGSSGYAQIFLFFLVFLEPWRGFTRITILICVYLLCIPADLALWPVIQPPAHSWLGARDVIPDFGVSLGQLLRPAVLLIVQFGLIALNLQDSLGARGGLPATGARLCGDLPIGSTPSVRQAETAAQGALPPPLGACVAAERSCL
ncbi:MAG: hypothetical protein ABI376_07280, partial [Caulobacteraceae bacterium]